MANSQSRITVLFEEPFWVCIFERENGNKYEVCKITFGAEPKDYEVYDFLIHNWSRLRFSPPVKVKATSSTHINPKRMQRLITRQVEQKGIGTKAQQALKLQQEQGKIEKKTRTRQQREQEKGRLFELRTEKRKDKHKGH